ncbi:hypothetical protein ACFLV6_01015 [Chloroflexota bacterium]
MTEVGSGILVCYEEDMEKTS